MLKDTTSHGLCDRVRPPHTIERRGGGGSCEQGDWRGGEGSAKRNGQKERQRHIRLIRIAAVLAAASRLCSSGHCRMPRGEREMNRSVVALASRWPSAPRSRCRKRRRKNSPCRMCW